jgi:peptide/nickel transport system substrate-binding protein
MKRSHHSIMVIFLFLAAISMILTSCTPAATETFAPPETSQTDNIVQTEAVATEEQQIDVTGPKSGGNFIFTGFYEPDTLDPALTSSVTISQNLGASLVTIDPQGEIVPYLAESWSISDDQLTWTFQLRQDVKFSDGSPLTAEDFAWSYNRGINPETASPVLSIVLGDMANAEATDDYTLVMHYNTPNTALLFNSTLAGYTQPISQAAFERLGDDFGRNPIGVGPFILQEWVTGDHITLARNPDYNWGPAFAHAGPAYLDTVEFRFIPEYATILAGLEAGDILGTDKILPQDVQRLRDLEEFQVFESTHCGIWPGIFMNASVSPFGDVKVRQALSYVVDRAAIQQIVFYGLGQIISGPLNSGTYGYNPDLEQYGYTYDLEKAAALLEEAGYTLNADNI